MPDEVSHVVLIDYNTISYISFISLLFNANEVHSTCCKTVPFISVLACYL